MTDKELEDFIHHGETGFLAFAMMFGDGWAQQAIAIAKELRARLAQPEPEPVAWMTYESEHRLRSGGNHRGAVPVHQKSSREAKIPLYTAPQLRSKDA